MSIAPTNAVRSDELRRLKHRRKQVLVVGIAFGAALLTIVDSSWRSEWPRVHRGIQWTGLMLILVCIFGRTWCTLYIGGMKLRALVTKGPYSVVRNPLYLFTLLGAGGIGALSGSVSMAALCIAFAALVFTSVVRREEEFLLATFPH
jgi:protein-S-isoprenylcysteine O-methyltransferase Ste14